MSLPDKQIQVSGETHKFLAAMSETQLRTIKTVTGLAVMEYVQKNHPELVEEEKAAASG